MTIRRFTNRHAFAGETSVRRSPLVCIFGPGGWGTTEERTYDQAAIALGIASPFVLRVEADVTPWTGREDLEAALDAPNPDQFVRLLLPDTDCRAIVEEHGSNEAFHAWRVVDPAAVGPIRSTRAAGGYQNPATIRLVLEVNSQALDNGLREIERKLLTLRDRKVPGWQVTDELRVFILHSANGSVGTNAFPLADQLRTRLDHVSQNVTMYMVTALNAGGRVPDRRRAAALQWAFLCEAHARTSGTDVRIPVNPVSLHLLADGGADERAFTAALATTTALCSLNDGVSELLGALTNARDENCGNAIDLCTSVVAFDPSSFVERALAAVTASAVAKLGAPNEFADREAERAGSEVVANTLGDAATLTNVVRINGNSIASAAEAIVRAADRETGRRTPRPIDRIQALVPAVTARARTVDLRTTQVELHHRFNELVDDISALVNGRRRAGRSSEALSIIHGAQARLAELSQDLREIAEGPARRQQIDAHLARANRTISELASTEPTDAEAEADPETYWRIVLDFIRRLFRNQIDVQDRLTLDTARQEVADAAGDFVLATLESLVAAVAARELDDCRRCLDRVRSEAEAFAARLERIRNEAEARLHTVDARLLQQQCRVRGVLLHAQDDMRAAIVETLLTNAEQSAAVTFADVLRRRGEVGADDGEILDEVVDQIRPLFQMVETWTLREALEHLPDNMVHVLADVLADQPSMLRFRRSRPAPLRSVRVAIPGGGQSRLGAVVRRRHTGIEVTDSPAVHLAFGIGVNKELFGPTDLEGYHAGWFAAFEEMRDRGQVGQLFSHRDLITVDDGVLTTTRIDRLIVQGIAAGVLARSQSRWYLLKPGERRRPADLRPGQLRSLPRLGASLPTIRTSFRSQPAHRRRVEAAWSDLMASVPVQDVIAIVERLAAGTGVPNPELCMTARELANELKHERMKKEATNGDIASAFQRNYNGGARPAGSAIDQGTAAPSGNGRPHPLVS